MAQPLGQLGRADQPAGAAADGLPLGTNGERAALRAVIGEDEWLGRFRPPGQHDLDHLRDHVARPLDHHRVADADVLALDIVLVVQRGPGDHDAANRDRRQLGHRRQGTRPADLDRDRLDDRLGLLGRELVGDGPARRPADEAQPLLQVDPVDLVDHAVDVVGQRVALGTDPLLVGQQLFSAIAALGGWIHPEASGPQSVEKA